MKKKMHIIKKKHNKVTKDNRIKKKIGIDNHKVEKQSYSVQVH